MKTLPEEIKQQTRALKKEGDTLQMQQKYLKAVGKYQEALDLIPEPFTEWKYSRILLSQMAENYHLNAKFNNSKGGGYEEALNKLSLLMQCDKSVGISAFHAQIGIIRYEMGNLEKAADEFLRVYLIDGPEDFHYLLEKPEYLELIKPIIEAGNAKKEEISGDYEF